MALDGTKKGPRWMRLLLAVSLAINLLVAGLVLGAVLRAGGLHGAERAEGPPPSLRSLGLTPFYMALDPEDRHKLRDEARARSGSFRESREALRARFAAMLAALKAEPFDAGALRDIARQQREAGMRWQALGDDILMARIAAMSPAERAAYADRLEKSFRHAPRPERH